MTLMSIEDSPEEEHSSFFYQVNAIGWYVIILSCYKSEFASRGKLSHIEIYFCKADKIGKNI